MGHRCGPGCYRKQGRRAECPSCNRYNKNRRLRRQYAALPKTRHGGETTEERHKEIRPEWVVSILNAPHDRWQETDRNGEPMTVLVGRVPEYNRWIKLVFYGTPEAGEFHTAYPDRRLEKDYGGRPWRNLL